MDIGEEEPGPTLRSYSLKRSEDPKYGRLAIAASHVGTVVYPVSEAASSCAMKHMPLLGRLETRSPTVPSQAPQPVLP
ncbi:hypothetical protein CIB48_g6517 [Xylaria polymorpha]|nr:hypothetical protein CIB48_g6517 [Xylaria polymorpha]